MAQPQQPPLQQQQHPQLPYSGDADWEHRLRRYLLLLASLVATVTYAAGLEPPGGSWGQSEDEEMAVAGDPILRATNHRLYLVFYYSNATAFAASLVVILLLLVLADKKDDKKDRPLDKKDLQTTNLRVLRIVMVLDLLALLVAYTAGSCREKIATIYTVALVAALSAYVGYHILEALRDNSKRARAALQAVVLGSSPLSAASTQLEQLRKVLMLLSIFAATITYDAGLKPPGGFWEHTTHGGLHRPGEVILKHKHGGRFAIFFFCNTAAFIASLFTIVLLLDKKLTANAKPRLIALCGFVLITLVTLVAAYAAGSCRNTATTTYTVALVAAVLVSIFLAALAGEIGNWLMECLSLRWGESDRPSTTSNCDEPDEKKLKEKRSLVLLLGTLAASITYQAGLNPPGGVWLENLSGSHGHNAGDPILLKTDDKRYSIFFYCNSTAFVASVVVILMVQIKALLKQNALRVAMILDLFGLIGAYIAGSSRTLRASIHLVVLAAAFLVYVTATYLHVKFKEANANSEDSHQPQNAAARKKRSLKKRRKRLLLFAILMAAITYQAGLSPPGGFWRVEQGYSSIGSPILEDMYPRRYKAFFYCNAMSFMASIALIILLQDDKTYQPKGIRFYGLYACMLVGMLVLMGAYAAGTARRVRTSIYVFVLVGGVSVFIAVLLALFLFIRLQQHQAAAAAAPAEANANGGGTPGSNNDDNNDNHHPPRPGGGGGHHAKRNYVMLLAMLAASVTYQAGLDPPGGVWSDGQDAGSSVLHDSNLARYHVFFYSNSSSFMASVVVIILLLQSEWLKYQQEERERQQDVQSDMPLLLTATNTVIALDLVGLLVAYAAGSSRTMDASLYVIVLVVAVVIYIAVHVGLPTCDVSGGEGRNTTAGNGTNGQDAADATQPSQV